MAGPNRKTKTMSTMQTLRLEEEKMIKSIPKHVILDIRFVSYRNSNGGDIIVGQFQKTNGTEYEQQIDHNFENGVISFQGEDSKCLRA